MSCAVWRMKPWPRLWYGKQARLRPENLRVTENWVLISCAVWRMLAWPSCGTANWPDKTRWSEFYLITTCCGRVMSCVPVVVQRTDQSKLMLYKTAFMYTNELYIIIVICKLPFKLLKQLSAFKLIYHSTVFSHCI